MAVSSPSLPLWTAVSCWLQHALLSPSTIFLFWASRNYRSPSVHRSGTFTTPVNPTVQAENEEKHQLTSHFGFASGVQGADRAGLGGRCVVRYGVDV